MVDARKTVANYFLNGGVEGRYFIDDDGIVYQIRCFREVIDVAHGGESLGWSADGINIGHENLEFPRMVNSIFRDSEATPEEVKRATESALKQKIASDPCANCAQILEAQPGESYACRSCRHRKN